MPRYLSPEWFAAAGARAQCDEDGLVLEQVVEGSPDGNITYRVVVGPSGPAIEWPVAPGAAPADLRLTSDWRTAVAIATGEISTQRALMEGRLRVKGDTRRLADHEAALAGADPLGVELRSRTTY